MLQVYRMVLDQAVSEPGADAAEVDFAKRLRTTVIRAMSALPAGLPLLDRGARDFVSLMLRSQLLGKRFLPHGSVAVGLANFLHNVRTAMLAAERTEDGVVTGHALSAVLNDHVRLTHNRSIREIQKKHVLRSSTCSCRVSRGAQPHALVAVRSSRGSVGGRGPSLNPHTCLVSR